MARKRLWIHSQRSPSSLPLLPNSLSLSLPLSLPHPDPDSGSDFKLDAFNSPCETLTTHYGVGGYNGDGDITKPENQSEFRRYVMEGTEGRGVHFVMADGVSVVSLSVCVCGWSVVNLFQGISVEGQENIQELLLKQLVLCQYLTTLHILRPGLCEREGGREGGGEGGRERERE